MTGFFTVKLVLGASWLQASFHLLPPQPHITCTSLVADYWLTSTLVSVCPVWYWKKIAVDIWQYYKIRISVDRPSTKNQQNSYIDHHHRFIIIIDYRQLIIICPSISKIIISITSSIHHHRLIIIHPSVIGFYVEHTQELKWILILARVG
jgi:hypothetical protein